MRKWTAQVLVLLTCFCFTVNPVLACLNPPPGPVPVQVLQGLTGLGVADLVIGGWTTFGASAGQSCVCGFRLPTSIVASVAFVALRDGAAPLAGPFPGPSAPGFFEPWEPIGSIAAELEAIRPAGTGEQWFGLTNNLIADSVQGGAAHFVVTVFLQAGKSAADLEAALLADPTDRIFTDESDILGVPTGGHQALTDFAVGTPIPAASAWGIALMAMLLLGSGAIMLRRRAPAQIS